MRELSDKECNRLATDCGLPYATESERAMIRAGYAAGYAAAQAAMPPMEPTGATIRCPRCGHAQELAFHYAQVPYNEQTSGPGEQPSLQARTGTGDAGPLDHQSAAGTNCATEEGARPSPESARGPAADHQRETTSNDWGAMMEASKRAAYEAASAVTDGPAADPIADLCAELRATHCSNENLHDNAAYELERLARTELLLRACMRHETARAERAEAERDALRECVLAADQTARFDLAWLISAINVHRHLPRPVGPELPKWYAENDRWLREASEMLNKIYSAENTPGSAAQPAEPPARSGRTRHDL